MVQENAISAMELAVLKIAFFQAFFKTRSVIIVVVPELKRIRKKLKHQIIAPTCPITLSPLMLSESTER